MSGRPASERLVASQRTLLDNLRRHGFRIVEVIRVPGDDHRVIAISTELVSGRRIVPRLAAPTGAGRQ